MEPEMVEKIKAAFAGMSPGEIEAQLTASKHAASIRDVTTLSRYVAGIASGEIDPTATA